MSGRPPRAAAGHDDEEDGEGEYNEEEQQDGAQNEERDEEGAAEAEDDEEGGAHEEDEDDDNRPDTSGSGVPVEFISAPEEKPLPAHYALDIGGAAEFLVAFSNNNNSSRTAAAAAAAATTAASSAATSASPTPQSFIPGTHKPSGDQRQLCISDEDSRMPRWLHYILNDDFASLSYLIHPPPGAHIDLSGVDGGGSKNKKKRRGAGNDDDDGGNGEDEEDGDREGEDSRPTSSRGGGADTEDSEGNLNGGRGSGMEEIAYHPNARFTLMPNPDAPNAKWNLVPYEPPASRGARGAGRPGSAQSENAEDAVSQHSRGSAGARSDGAGGGGDDDDERDDGENNNQQRDDAASAAAKKRSGDVDEHETAPGTIVVDALTLAAMFSPDALAMLVKERMPQYRVPGGPADRAAVAAAAAAATGGGAPEDYEDDSEEAAARNRPQPPSLYTFWRWCEVYGGLVSDLCTPLQQLIKVCTAAQAEEGQQPSEDNKNKKRKRGGAAAAEEEAGGEEEDGDENAAADGGASNGSKQTLAQKRRLFMSFGRLFDLISSARTVGEAQQVESIIRALIVDANIAPSAPVHVASRALRNTNTLQAYVTFLEIVPRSIISSAAWIQAVPLTEAEIASYPDDGSVAAPDEHPAALHPRLWKIVEHVRRRVAKDAKQHLQPKRSLVDVLKKLFTPSAEDLGVDPELVKPGPMIHTEPESNGIRNSNSQEVSPAANVDPLLFQGFDANRDYPPHQLRLYLSDVVLAILGRHDLCADALAWLGGLKREYPHQKWHPVGSGHVLAMSLGRMTEKNALLTVSKLLDPDWFAPCSRVALSPFLRDVASDPAPRCLDSGAFRSAAVTDYFAKHFCPVIVQRHAAAIVASASSCHGNNNNNKAAAAKEAKDAISVMVAKIETEYSALATKYQQVQALADKFVATVQSAHPEEDIDTKLDAIEASSGRTVLATNMMLRMAADAKQLSAVHWLVRRGVGRVDHTRGSVPVLEYCVESGNDAVLLSLAEKYADLKAPLLGGRSSILAAVQEHRAAFGGGEKAVRRIEAAVAESRAWRGADPTQDLGVKIGSIIC